MRIGELELRRLAVRRASKVGVPLVGTVHIDPLTGDTVRRITRSWSGGQSYPPCAECIGYPCECGTAGEGCGL